MSVSIRAARRAKRFRLRQSTCLTLLAGAAALQSASAPAQILSLSGLNDSLNALTTTVTAQGTQITATTNLANSLNTNVNTLTTTVANQAATLQTVQAATSANISNLATVTAAVNLQQTQLTANTSLLNTVSSGLGTLGSTVAAQGTTLQGLQTTVAGNVTNLATLTTTVNQQGAQVSANTSLLGTVNAGLGTLGATVATQMNALQGLQATVAGNVAEVGTLTTTVNQQGAQLTANTNLLGTVNAGLGTLGSTVADQATALQGLQATVSGNVADVATLTASLNQQGARISANLGALTTLNDGMTALATSVAGQGQTVQALQGSVGTLTGDVAIAVSEIARQSTDIGALQASVGANVTDVAALRATLGTTGSDVTGLQTQVADHEVRIAANIAQLGTLGVTVGAQGATLTQQGSDLATAAANIASLQGLVAAQAGTLGTLGTAVAAQGTLLGDQDARITANADAILSLRAMSVSGNVSPVQYVTPGAPTVATTTPTNDVAVLGAQHGPVRVHNVADGQVAAGSSDAINGGQLYDVSQQVSGLAAATVRYDDSTRARITLGGANAAPVMLANVAPGSTAPGSTDAVNGGQLADTNAAVAALHDDVTSQAGDLATARSSLAALGTTVTAQGVLLGSNASAIAAVRSDTERGAIGPVRYSDPAIPTVPNGGIVTQSLTLVGRDPGPVSLHNVAEAQLSSGSTDAVNGGQLFALAQSFQGLSDLALRYDDSGRGSATLGTAGVPVGLRNVAAGTLAAGSSDAATAGQLFDTNQTVGTLTNVAALQAGLIGALDSRVGGLSQDLDQLNTALDGGARGPVRYSDAATPTTPNGGRVSQDLTFIGAGSGPVRLHGVADGLVAAGSFDSVNGNQLFALGNATASALGSGFRYNPASGFTGNFTFNGRSYGSVQSVFGAIETSLATAPATGSGGSGSTGAGGANTAGTKYFRANSTMADSAASGFDSTAIGPASASSGEAAIAVGRNAVAGGTSSVAIGDGAKAMDGKAVSIGLGNVASGDGAVAIGDPNYATGAGATALGKDNNATGIGAIALGNVNVASGDGSTAIGSTNQASGLGAAALGFTNVASGNGAIAIGTNNSATGDGALAIGANVVTNAADTLAIGNTASAQGTRAVAIGNMAAATATYAAAFGFNAEARDSYSTAVGTVAHAEGFGSTAVGTLASASGFATSAIGSGAIADKDGSVALGSASQTTRGAVSGYTAFGLTAPQASLGEVAIARNIAYLNPGTNTYSPIGNRQITGVAAGAADTDAVNVSQLRGVSSAMGAALVAGFGGGASYDGLTGALAAPSYTLDGVTYSSVGDALQAINARLSGAPAGTPGAPSNGAAGGAPPRTNTDGGPTPAPVSAGDAGAGASTQLTATTTRVAAVETRVSSVETKAEAALAASSRSIQYDGDGSDSVTLGGEKAVALHNLAPGTSDGDAVNVAQLNGAMGAAVDAANSYTDQRVAALSFDLGRVNRDLSAGVAGALAMAGMPQPYEEGKSMFSLGAGTFQGQSAVAMGVSRIMEDGHTIVKLGATYNSRKRIGANVGIGYQF
ncbi:YadA-like family protein [Sphingomonas sp. BK580]|uniref:YadA-like family protein n=1 Tax=Sphingomonas sp. BK580 TaxID=2586972 RepID=UPI0016094BDD|nr:YadA-like family protein [Sphingomonas sp. BK580]MBB3691937.1 autotransporter adhesin [Sphingomonas sp. BK580]